MFYYVWNVGQRYCLHGIIFLCSSLDSCQYQFRFLSAIPIAPLLTSRNRMRGSLGILQAFEEIWSSISTPQSVWYGKISGYRNFRTSSSLRLPTNRNRSGNYCTLIGEASEMSWWRALQTNNELTWLISRLVVAFRHKERKLLTKEILLLRYQMMNGLIITKPSE